MGMHCDVPSTCFLQLIVREVEFCARFRGCDHIINLLAACLGPQAEVKQQEQRQQDR